VKSGRPRRLVGARSHLLRAGSRVFPGALDCVPPHGDPTVAPSLLRSSPPGSVVLFALAVVAALHSLFQERAVWPRGDDFARPSHKLGLAEVLEPFCLWPPWPRLPATPGGGRLPSEGEGHWWNQRPQQDQDVMLLSLHSVSVLLGCLPTASSASPHPHPSCTLIQQRTRPQPTQLLTELRML